MIYLRSLASIALAPWLLAAAARAQSSAPDSVHYGLASPPSEFESGCFGPCACPILIRSPLAGSFTLRPSGFDPLFTYYDVLDVHWKLADGVQPSAITGSGTYRRGGEIAIEEQLTLDLSFDGGPPQHFDSGLRSPGAPFPEIYTRISLHDEFCHDSVLVVDARLANVGVPWGYSPVPGLTVAPNPFRSSTEIAVLLPRDGMVDLGVFDLAGRRLRTLAAHEWLPSGAHVRAWDGRLEDREAPAGLYFLCLDGPSGRTTRLATKLH